MSTFPLYFRLAGATALVLAPGWLLARALGVRGVAATLAWSLVFLFGALAATFLFEASLTFTLAILGAVTIAALGAFFTRGRELAPTVAGRWWAAGAGTLLGILLWRVSGDVQGDGLFHLARTRKLAEFDELSLEGVGEFADGSLHPGYAFPLWHGFLALIAKLADTDAEQVVLHLPSILAPLAVLAAYEAGWALFRRTWAAGATAGAQVVTLCFAPGHGGSFPELAQPATSSRLLLVPAALALALAAIRDPSSALFATTAAAGFVLAVVHPTYALFLWLPFVGFLAVRALWAREDVRAGGVALGALAVPAALFMLWLIPVVGDTASVTPDSAEVQRAIEQYPGQLDVRSETSYSLAPGVISRSGPVTVAALLLIPLAAFAPRRRWAAFVVGGSLAVFALMLIPFLFTALSDLVSISQARRAAGFLPFAFAFAGGFGVLSRIIGPLFAPMALVAGALFQYLYPGDFSYVLDDPGPAWVVWVAVVGALSAFVAARFWRRRPHELGAGIAAALFLLPVVVVGLARWTPTEPPPGGSLSEGLIEYVRVNVPQRSIVYSDEDTSYLLAAYAPVYIAVAPPGHVADTETNRPYQRAEDARTFLETGDLSIPQSYGADYLLIERRLTRQRFDLPELYRDNRFSLYPVPARF